MDLEDFARLQMFLFELASYYRSVEKKTAGTQTADFFKVRADEVYDMMHKVQRLEERLETEALNS